MVNGGKSFQVLSPSHLIHIMGGLLFTFDKDSKQHAIRLITNVLYMGGRGGGLFKGSRDCYRLVMDCRLSLIML